MVTKEEFRKAMVVVESYCGQVGKKKNAETNEIGCRVKLSEWGLEMQGKRNRGKRGIVVDFSEGVINKIRDGTVTVKWDGVSKPSQMHISQVSKA